MIKALQIFAILSTIGVVSCGIFPEEEQYDADGVCINSDNCTATTTEIIPVWDRISLDKL